MLRDFLRSLKNPYQAVTFLGMVIGIGLSIYFYIAPQQQARISYHIEQITIFEPPKFSTPSSPDGRTGELKPPFTILDGNGHPITSGIYGATIVVWNSGDIDLGKEKIRKPLTISISGETRLIEGKFEIISDENISEFQLERPAKQEHEMQVSWRYFDPRHAFKFRLFYISDRKQEINISAQILGLHQILPYSSANKPRALIDDIVPTILFIFSLIGSIAIGVFFADIMLKLRERVFGTQKNVRLLMTQIFIIVISCFIVVFMFIFIIYILLNINKIPSAPFW